LLVMLKGRLALGARMNDRPEDVAPAGWYVDPKTSLHLRWWSGREWTGHIAPLPDLGHAPIDSSRDVPPTTGSVASTAPPRSRPAPERASQCPPKRAPQRVPQRVPDATHHEDPTAGATAVSGAKVAAGPDAGQCRTLTGRSSTTSVWLIAFTPWLMLLAVIAALLMYAWGVREWLQYAAVALPWLLTIACAERDVKRLRSWGHTKVASVAWSLLGAPAYLIARIVVLCRTADAGAGPLWLWLANLLTVTGTGLLLISLGHDLVAAARP
jgi:Protein of unknown function (DUF2510)